MSKFPFDSTRDHLEGCRSAGPAKYPSDLEVYQISCNLHSEEAGVFWAERQQRIRSLEVHLPEAKVLPLRGRVSIYRPLPEITDHIYDIAIEG